MDRTASILAHLEALAALGVGADRLALEIQATIRAWHLEAAIDAERLMQALAACSLQHDSDRESAIRRGMTAEGQRQKAIATALLQAATARHSDHQRPQGT